MLLKHKTNTSSNIKYRKQLNTKDTKNICNWKLCGVLCEASALSERKCLVSSDTFHTFLNTSCIYCFSLTVWFLLLSVWPVWRCGSRLCGVFCVWSSQVRSCLCCSGGTRRLCEAMFGLLDHRQTDTFKLNSRSVYGSKNMDPMFSIN